MQQETTDLTIVAAYLSKLSDLIDLFKNSPDNLPDYLPLIEKAQRTLELIGYYDQSLVEPDTDRVLLSQKNAEIEKLLKEKLSKLDIFIKKSNQALTQTRLVHQMVDLVFQSRLFMP